MEIWRINKASDESSWFNLTLWALTPCQYFDSIPSLLSWKCWKLIGISNRALWYKKPINSNTLISQSYIIYVCLTPNALWTSRSRSRSSFWFCNVRIRILATLYVTFSNWHLSFSSVRSWIESILSLDKNTPLYNPYFTAVLPHRLSGVTVLSKINSPPIKRCLGL